MAITPLPALDRTSATFKADADAFFATHLPTFSAEANAAAVAMNLNSTTDTSATSNAIGTGAKTFTVSTGKSFLAGMYLVIADTAAPSTNSMAGQVTSYNTETGELVMSITLTHGSGTKAAWTISQSAPFENENPFKIHSITSSVIGSSLLATLKPCIIDFRSTTLSDGIPNTRVVNSDISLLVPGGGTLGTVNAVQSRIVVLAIDNAGTVELAVVNIAGGNNLNETTLINTTALSAGSTSANVIYSTTARTGVPFRVVGYIESTQATAGTWATAPSTVQGAGGNALASMGSVGYGQTWQVVTRTLGTTYYNTTGRPICLSVWASDGSAGNFAYISVNGITAAQQGIQVSNQYVGLTAIIPPSASYVVSVSGLAFTITATELR